MWQYMPFANPSIWEMAWGQPVLCSTFQDSCLHGETLSLNNAQVPIYMVRPVSKQQHKSKEALAPPTPIHTETAATFMVKAQSGSITQISKIRLWVKKPQTQPKDGCSGGY